MKIYKITNNVNGKIYIGKTTKSIKRRLSRHKSDARANKGYRLHEAIRKYGEDNFSIELLEECNSEQQYHIIESLYIKDLNAVVKGYNMTYGGEGEIRTIESYKKQSEKIKGREFTPEHCANISKALKASTWEHPMTGKQYSDTSMFKGNKQAGKYNKILKGQSVICIEDSLTFQSMREAAQHYGIADSSIQRSIKNKTGFIKKLNKTFKFIS